jgi:cytoskeletal protein CcmA (bactofilin family)
MSAVVPPSASGPRPAAPAAPAPPPPRSGPIRDRGSVRRDSVHATNWSSTGIAKVLGDVDVGSGEVAGLVSVGGKLRADAFHAEGTFEVVGAVEVRDGLAVEGTAQFRAPVHAGELTTDGTLRSAAEVRVDRILSAVGLVEAPSARVGAMRLHGSATVPGPLEAQALVLAEFRGDSRIGTIRAAKAVLHGPSAGLVPTLMRSVLGGEAAVHVDRVEADSVELAAVDVGFVHAREIVLGAGAHVTTVEGTIVRRHPSARVGFESRSPPPHGLSR